MSTLLGMGASGWLLRVCGATDVGLRREQNEDEFLIADLGSGETSSPCVQTEIAPSRAGSLLLVCDGMGGAAAGEVAARIAAESIKQTLAEGSESVTAHPRQSLAGAVVGAHQAILEEAKVHPEERGMGTTCTAGIVLPGKLVLAQVGDSRAYLSRQGRLTPLTRDQTLATALVDAGVLRPEEVRTSPQRNVLSQALGSRHAVEPVISELVLRPGDRLLLCSDGLHGPVSERDIERTLALPPDHDLSEVAATLVKLALAAGGPDNVTVVVAEYGPAAAADS